jgi:hypothetical protein
LYMNSGCAILTLLISGHFTLFAFSSRPLGYAELLVEASFVDLKYGGDGDLSQVLELRQKVIFSYTPIDSY